MVAMAAMSVACVDGNPNGGGGGGRGGFPEPGHRAESGPCFLIKPLEVMAKDLRQAAQTADAIFNYNYPADYASCNRADSALRRSRGNWQNGGMQELS